MPKAAVDKQDRTMFREHEIGIAGQVPAVEAEAKTHRVGGAAYAHFGRSVLRAYARH